MTGRGFALGDAFSLASEYPFFIGHLAGSSSRLRVASMSFPVTAFVIAFILNNER